MAATEDASYVTRVAITLKRWFAITATTVPSDIADHRDVPVVSEPARVKVIILK